MYHSLGLTADPQWFGRMTVMAGGQADRAVK